MAIRTPEETIFAMLWRMLMPNARRRLAIWCSGSRQRHWKSHFLRTKSEFERGPVPSAVEPVLQSIAGADHLLIVFPLWLGETPALLKALFEHIFRPGFAFQYTDRGFPR